MIATTAPRETSLDLVKLIFSLAIESPENVPDGLKLHLTNILTEAKKLSLEVNEPAEVINPEAIELALDMKANAVLAKSVDKITSFESITPTIASNILDAMRGASPAY